MIWYIVFNDIFICMKGRVSEKGNRKKQRDERERVFLPLSVPEVDAASSAGPKPNPGAVNFIRVFIGATRVLNSHGRELNQKWST